MSTKKLAVLLSGCGYLDGSEIHESILTLLALDRAQVQVQCFAPNIPQTQVVNHLTGEKVDNEQRNVLVEAARITRGDIKDIKQANANDFDGLIFPGGFGAALNLSDFATQGENCKVNPDVLNFARSIAQASKPIGFICIAPAMIPIIYGESVKLTIGNDQDTAKVLESMGAKHIECSVDNIIVDETHKIVSTPAYMLGPSISHVEKGINKLVQKVLTLS